MTALLSPIKRLLKGNQPLSSGLYHYQSPEDDPRNYRLHLRLEVDGSGILIINASTILHLNQSAAEYAYYMLQNKDADFVAKTMAKRYQIAPQDASRDYLDFADQIQSLVNTPDLDPVTFLGFERQAPFSKQISAPYRLDCAITYKVLETDAGQVAPLERVKRELAPSEWKQIINKAWQAGIPHIVFTGGEPTLRRDLPELIETAETNGQVAGLITDGIKLADKNYLDKLLQTGLDHLTIVLDPHRDEAWQALSNALPEDLFVTVHLTLNESNFDECLALLDRLVKQGVKAISISATGIDLAPQLEQLRQKIADNHLDLIWNLPTPYSAMHPVALETGISDLPQGAGNAFLYLEPDGDVLPAQGVNRVLGNFLQDSWDKIHKSGG